jgi:ribonuclease Z
MLELAGHVIRGLSIGGLETCIDLPAFKIAFDIGRGPDFAVARETIFFTHAHMDHMGGVAWHCATRSLRGMKPPTYVMSPGNVEAFEDLFAAWRRLDRSDLEHTTVGLAPGAEHALKNLHFVRPFRSPHRVECQGYAVWSRRPKLKPEFAGLPPDEIRRQRVELGVEVTSSVETPEVAFTGDSLIEVVEREEVVRKARVLIIEATFLDERVPVADCRAKGHIHLDEVIERAELFENEALLLTHFSERYSNREILEILDRRLPESLRTRVTPLLAGRKG